MKAGAFMLVQEFPQDGKPSIIVEEKKRRRMTIDTVVTDDTHCVGYCLCIDHEGYLTKKLMSKHGCMVKKCPNFYKKIKNPNTKIGTARPDTGEAEKQRQILEHIQTYVKDNEDIKIVKAKRTGASEWTVYYATLCQIDMSDAQKSAEEQFDTAVRFEKLNYSFDKLVKLIYGDI